MQYVAKATRLVTRSVVRVLRTLFTSNNVSERNSIVAPRQTTIQQTSTIPKTVPALTHMAKKRGSRIGEATPARFSDSLPQLRRRRSRVVNTDIAPNLIAAVRSTGSLAPPPATVLKATVIQRKVGKRGQAGPARAPKLLQATHGIRQGPLLH